MVNGMFRLRSDWEKVAGQTWSTRPFCRPVWTLRNNQEPEKPEFSNLARLSLRTWRTARLGRASRGSAKDRQGIGKAAWESGGADRTKGRTTGGERASHRTFATDHARAPSRADRQQPRERQYQRLQGRPDAVRGVSLLGRA